MANEILKHKTASFDTDPEFGAEVAMGTLADEGTEIGDPEIQTETVGGGSPAAVGATLSPTLRVLGNGGAWLATLQGYVLDLTEVYLRVYGADGTSYTQYGPMIVTAAFAKGRTSDPRRQSVIVQMGTAADTADQIVTNGTTAT